VEYNRTKDHANSEDIEQDSGASALPCLNSNISTENPPPGTPGAAGAGEQAMAAAPPRLSTQHRKTAFVLQESVSLMIQKHGIENVGFLTLTFAQHITCPREAQRRLNSLLSHVIVPRYGDYLGVVERQKSGRLHYHLLVHVGSDIRSGVDFAALADRDYRSAGPALRSEWAFWRKTARSYGFGRTELLPVRTSLQAMAKYLGKYIAKHIEVRQADDKGVRLVRYGRGVRAGTTRFQFQSDGSREWRRKVATFAAIVQAQHPETPITQLSDLSLVLGKRWAYRHREYILNIT